MSFSSSLRISGSSLTAQRLRMDVIAGNIANANTTRSSDGGPYKRREVSLRADSSMSDSMVLMGNRTARSAGVRVAEVAAQEGVRLVNDPRHPDADENGNVAYPDIDLVQEMSGMMSAVRAYEASVTAANAAKSMATKSLELGKA